MTMAGLIASFPDDECGGLEDAPVPIMSAMLNINVVNFIAQVKYSFELFSIFKC